MADDGIEDLVRQRLRGLRVAMGYSLDELAARTHLSASTISRIETGKRTISLDMLQPLCDALQTDMATLLDTTTDEDVVIRPVASKSKGRPCGTSRGTRRSPRSVRSRCASSRAGRGTTTPRVHPGHDWFFVLSGTVLLTLGDREIEVQEGEAAEFSCMVPHLFEATGGPAEILTIFDRDGRTAHLGDHTTDAQESRRSRSADRDGDAPTPRGWPAISSSVGRRKSSSTHHVR